MAIIRGRMTFDQFTQVPNRWARDPRLSYKAKGLLTYILSHRDDYELSTEQAVREAKDGIDSVYSGLRELEKHGYLRRFRRRNADGTLGETDFHLVEPEGVPEPAKPQVTATPGKSRSGKPAPGTRHGKPRSGKPRSGETRSGESGPIEDQGVEDQGENTTPPAPAAEAPAAAGAPHGGRGDTPDEDPTEPVSPAAPVEPERARLARELVDAVPDLSGAARGRLARRAARCLAAGHPPEAVQAELRGDLAGAGDPVAVLMARLADLADTDPAPPRLVPRPRPPWCGECSQDTRQRELEDGRPARCPRCHPLVVDPAAEAEYVPAVAPPTFLELVDDPSWSS